MEERASQWEPAHSRTEPPTGELRDTVSAVIKRWGAETRTERATLEGLAADMARRAARGRATVRVLGVAVAMLAVAATGVVRVVERRRPVPVMGQPTVFVILTNPPAPKWLGGRDLAVPGVHVVTNRVAGHEVAAARRVAHRVQVEREVDDDLRWEAAAVGEDWARALVYLGWAYANGEGVGRDGGEAARLFRESAEAGNSEGAYSLGVLYANGSGVARSDSAAVVWFRRAAARGNRFASAELARRGLR
jgi:hypothetical protein